METVVYSPLPIAHKMNGMEDIGGAERGALDLLNLQNVSPVHKSDVYILGAVCTTKTYLKART